jgi:signal transduction histidine kinase
MGILQEGSRCALEAGDEREAALRSALDRVYLAINATLDFEEIMRRVLAEVLAAVGANSAGVLLHEGDAWVLRYASGQWEPASELRLSGDESRVCAAVLEQRQPVALADVHCAEEPTRSILEHYGVTAILAVPLILQQAVIGVLSLNFHEGPAHFTPAEMDFARHLALVVSLALQNARLFDAERQQRRLFEMLLAHTQAGIAVLEGDSLRVKWANRAAQRLVDEPYRSQGFVGHVITEVVPQAEENGMTEMLRYAAATRQPLARNEVKHVGFERGLTYWRWLVQPLDFAAGYVLPGNHAPIVVPGDLLAMATDITEHVQARRQTEDLAERLVDEAHELHRAHDEMECRVADRTRELTQREHALQMAMGALQRQTERLLILHDIDRAILAAQSPAEIAQIATERTRRAAGCRRAAVLLFDFDTSEAELLAVDDREALTWRAGARLPLELALIPAVQANESVSFIPDLAVAEDASEGQKSLLAEGLRAHLSVPLIADGRQIGAFALSDTKPGAFDDDDASLIQQVGASLAVALHNIRLFEQVRHHRAQLQRLSHRLVEVQEEERRAIARELHDESGQSLTALKVHLTLLQRGGDCGPVTSAAIDALKQDTESVMEGLHRLATHLRPAVLDRSGLVPALQQFVEEFRSQHAVDVEFVVSGLAADAHGNYARLPVEIETTIYRVVQEALTNVARHARATKAGVILERRSDCQTGRPAGIVAVVEDNGVGFDVQTVVERDRLGLLGMRERAEVLGGALAIESAPGAGTTIYVEVPLS